MLGKRHLEPSTPVKFALGIIQAGLGFGALVLGANFPDETGKVVALWLVLAYLLHTTGELCLSPVGLSAVSKLAVSVFRIPRGADCKTRSYGLRARANAQHSGGIVILHRAI